MSDSFFSFLVGIVFGGLLFLLVLVASGSRYADGVKDGQIDAINGKIKYSLVSQEDNSTIWEKRLNR